MLGSVLQYVFRFASFGNLFWWICYHTCSFNASICSVIFARHLDAYTKSWPIDGSLHELYIVQVQGDEVKWTSRRVSQKIHTICCCPFTRRSFHCVNQQLQCTLVSQRPISTPKSNSQLSPSIPQCLLSNQHRLTLPHSTTNLPGRLHIQQRHLYLIRYL